MKVKMIVAAVAVAGLTATAANAADNGKLQLQINQLKAQQTQLQQQVANLQGQGQTAGAVHVGPVGGELIASNNYNGRGLDLLKSIAKAGSNAPLLTIGGTLEADGQYNRNGTVGSGSTSGNPVENAYKGNSASAFYLDTARIDVLANVNDWVHGEMSYDLNSTASDKLHTGSLLIGNLNQLPVYGQIGKFYPDAGLFGLATDDIYSDNLAKHYFRPGAQNGASVGFYKAGLHTSLTAFKTSTTQANINNPNQATSDWSAQADYTFNAGQVNATVGAGYVSNIVNTNDDLTITGADKNTGRIPMANISAKVGVGPFDILATYAQSLKAVNNRTGIAGDTKLKAFDVEGAYHFQMVKPMTVMLGYSRTYGFDTANVTDTSNTTNTGPKHDQWLLGVNSEVFKNTTVGLEYARVSQYTNVIANSSNTSTSHYNVLTADMTVKF
ncbi:LbtU family siderophore porin [Piscirickettsia litoralis]|uniref:Porin domain-containing protein n=1 Tax=Piscirickettsia litoralis TaxID=1891921 RepID=A0ABX3A2S7_9GAMM|nr:LbtU family siderophore porin [Piscirickettsia litoralis]ODN42939.1 hypothetical protein BGC07_08405 [Piscirickettsia litoralis]